VGVQWNEELITVSNAEGKATSGKRSVFYRVVGDVKNENGSKDKGTVKGKRHLVLVVPDKFRDHEYLTTLEALVTSDRRVVLFDAMGSGQSQPLPAEQKAELEADEGKALAFAVKELSDMWGTLSKELKVDQVHVFGHAFGALVANEFAKSNPSAVASLILASPPAALGKPAAKQVCMHVPLVRIFAPCGGSACREHNTPTSTQRRVRRGCPSRICCVDCDYASGLCDAGASGRGSHNSVHRRQGCRGETVPYRGADPPPRQHNEFHAGLSQPSSHASLCPYPS
jgi:pimeloyl-ACP methyl ester carboxylesterase